MNPYALYISKYSTHNYIIKNIGTGKVVLDVGCNDGYIGASSNKSNIFYGLDYSKDSIKRTKRIYKDAVVFDLNDLKVLPWRLKFDVIIFADVLEHTLYPETVLKFFFDNYLKQSGIVIISLPNIANWRIRFSLMLGQFNYTNTGILDRTHLHLYTLKTSRQLINSAGLKIEKEYGSTKIFGYLIKLLPSLKGIFSINLIFVCRKN